MFGLMTAAATAAVASEPAVTLTSSGVGAYLLQGSSLRNAAALDITLTYDASLLARPRAAQGALLSNDLFMANTNTPGTIRIATVHSGNLNGTGVIASISFDAAGGDNGIKSLRVIALDPEGKKITLAAVIAPNDQQQNTASTRHDQPKPPADADAVSASAKPVLITGVQKSTAEPSLHDTGSQTGPVQQDPPTIAKADPVAPPSRPEAAEAATQGALPGQVEKKVFKFKSALDRFKEYKGPRTPEKLIALLKQEGQFAFLQDPAIALSDNITPVTVAVITTASTTSADFILQGGKIFSAERDKDHSNRWIVTLLPEKNAYDVRLSIKEPDALRILPLTVTPKVNADLDGSGKVTRKDFARYLASKGGIRLVTYGSSPADRNRYLDDYVFTANYVLALSPKAPRKR